MLPFHKKLTFPQSQRRCTPWKATLSSQLELCIKKLLSFNMEWSMNTPLKEGFLVHFMVHQVTAY